MGLLRHLSKHWQWIAVFLGSILVGSCGLTERIANQVSFQEPTAPRMQGTPFEQDLVARLYEASNLVEAINLDYERYGSITVSPAVFFNIQRSDFLYALQRVERDPAKPDVRIIKPDWYEDSKNVQGVGVSSDLLAVALGVQTNSNVGNFGDNPPSTPPSVSGSTNVTIGSGDAAATADGQGNLNLNLNTAVPTFQNRQAFSNDLGNNFTLSPQQLVRSGFDAHMTNQILSWMTGPRNFGNKQVLYGAIINVSLLPGQLTRQGYIGEAVVSARYAGIFNDDSCQFSGAANLSQTPRVFAVFPLGERQNLDLQSRFRRELALAILSRVQAPNIGAQITGGLQRILQGDARTLDQNNTVVGFNSAGRVFGWRFSPRFSAQTTPGLLRRSAGGVLNQETFPALVLVMMDKHLLTNDVGGDFGSNTPRCGHTTGFGEVNFAKAPYNAVNFTTDVRWYPSAQGNNH